ncbi:MAG: tetratricopeptide repeat protein [Phycisphaerales bacterium]
MRHSSTGVLVRISAAIGLLACLGVFAAGLLRPNPSVYPTVQPDPIAQEFERGMGAFRAQEWVKAIAAFKHVVEENPKHAAAWFQLALSVHSSGDFQGALELHEKAAEFPRNRAIALYNLGCAHAMLGQADEAFKALDRAAEAGFTNAEYAKEDSELESLRADPRFSELMQRMLVPDNALLRFWVGEWDVYDANTGARAGSNSLTLRNNDLFILEHWTDSQGGSGESFNYFDPAMGKWKQVWSDPNGVVEFVGTRQDEGILFEGKRLLPGGAPPILNRMHVRPIGEGHVRQTGTRWDEKTQTWLARYDLIYVPKGEAYEPDLGKQPAADI